ncbi:unnamed protein product, partial [Mycena citricolor]
MRVRQLAVQIALDRRRLPEPRLHRRMRHPLDVLVLSRDTRQRCSELARKRRGHWMSWLAERQSRTRGKERDLGHWPRNRDLLVLEMRNHRVRLDSVTFPLPAVFSPVPHRRR